MEHNIIGLMFIEKPTEDNIPTLQLALQVIDISDIISLVQYKYSDSIEAAEKKHEMYRLSKNTFFDNDSHYALCTDSKGNHYQVNLSNVSDELKNKYLKVVEI